MFCVLLNLGLRVKSLTSGHIQVCAKTKSSGRGRKPVAKREAFWGDWNYKLYASCSYRGEKSVRVSVWCAYDLEEPHDCHQP